MKAEINGGERDRTNDKIAIVIFVLLSPILLLSVFLSLRWGMAVDYPIMMYIALLMDQYHCVPYRDFFDMNPPGTYFVNVLIGRVFGYGDFGFRFVNLLYLSAILTATWLWMKKLGWKVAGCGALLFGLIYLGFGHEISLEREFIIILPVIVALLFCSSMPKLNDNVKGLVIGFLFGLSATIKPHAAIAFPLVLIFLLLNVRQRGGESLKRSPLLSIICFSIVGFALPVFAVFAYLLKNGALSYFWDMAENYWPLYKGLTLENQTVFGYERIRYLFRTYKAFGHQSLWFLPAALGVYISFYHSNFTPAQKRQVALLIGLVICYSIYTVLAGQFWYYHWLPFTYFLVLLASLCFVAQSGAKTKIQRLYPVFILLFTIIMRVHPPPGFVAWTEGQGLETQRNERAEQIAAYLQANLETGDKVQPLDWTGGAVHAMLLTRAQLATPFLYDFHFYHHISDDYIQSLRKRFMESLASSQPRFIIQVVADDKPWVSGEDTTRKFAELQALLETNYFVVQEGDGYFIHERRPHVSG